MSQTMLQSETVVTLGYLSASQNLQAHADASQKDTIQVEEIHIAPESLWETEKHSDGRDGAACPRSIELGTETLVELTAPTQNALLVTEQGGYNLVDNFPVPELGPGEVMIRNYATGLNHIDWKSVDYNFCLPARPWVTGREMAGVVDRVGAGVTDFVPGDRVWTSTYYKDRRAGCFQDLVVVPQHTVFLIPSNIDFNTSACFGVAALTAAMSLWRWLGIAMPSAPFQQNISTPKDTLLVWGGSTVTGQFAIQLAAKAGVEVIAVCSESTAGLVSSLGAAHVVTYTGKTDLHVIGEILCVCQGRLTKAIDLVGARTAGLVLQVIAAYGSAKIDFAPLAFMSGKQVIPANAVVHNVEMKQFVLNSESRVYGQCLTDMIADRAIMLPKLRVLQGGLASVEAGLNLVKQGNLCGEKLVVSFTE